MEYLGGAAYYDDDRTSIEVQRNQYYQKIKLRVPNSIMPRSLLTLKWRSNYLTGDPVFQDYLSQIRRCNVSYNLGKSDHFAGFTYLDEFKVDEICKHQSAWYQDKPKNFLELDQFPPDSLHQVLAINGENYAYYSQSKEVFFIPYMKDKPVDETDAIKFIEILCILHYLPMQKIILNQSQSIKSISFESNKKLYYIDETKFEGGPSSTFTISAKDSLLFLNHSVYS